ncbi:hypothetical protein [Mucilaginibacter sp.]
MQPEAYHHTHNSGKKKLSAPTSTNRFALVLAQQLLQVPANLLQLLVPPVQVALIADTAVRKQINQPADKWRKIRERKSGKCGLNCKKLTAAALHNILHKTAVN